MSSPVTFHATPRCAHGRWLPVLALAISLQRLRLLCPPPPPTEQNTYCTAPHHTLSQAHTNMSDIPYDGQFQHIEGGEYEFRK